MEEVSANVNVKEEPKKKISPSKIMLIVSAILIGAALIQHLALTLVGGQAGQNLRMVSTDTEIFYGFEMHTSFYSPGSRQFFFGTRDGVQNISSAGEIRWQQGFNMTQPIMIGRGETIAMGEPDGRVVYVFGLNGLLYTANLDNPLLYFTVNQNAYLSVILRTNIGYEVQVFSPGGNSPIYRNTINDTNMFPLSVDVSECGTFIAVAFFNVDALMFSRVQLSYVRRTDSRGLPDGLIAWYDYSNEFVYRTRFTPDGTILVFTDNQILALTTDVGAHGPLWSIPLNNQPDKLYVGENLFAFVTGDPLLNPVEHTSPGILFIYDFDGNLSSTYDLGRRATHLSIDFNTVLVGTNRTFYAINAYGTRIWTYAAVQDVNSMLFLDNVDTVLMAGGTQATVLRRIREN
jgi:hypothetical protein